MNNLEKAAEFGALMGKLAATRRVFICVYK